MSWVDEIGTTLVRLTIPTLGLNPTMPLMLAGQVIEPLVSVPMAPQAKPAAIAAPLPDDDPQVLRSIAWGLRVRPPTRAPPAGRIVGADIGPFAEVGLAQHHPAGGAQICDQRRIAAGHVAFQGKAAGGSREVACINIVLYQHGPAFEDPRCRQCACLGRRVRVKGDDGIELRPGIHRARGSVR